MLTRSAHGQHFKRQLRSFQARTTEIFQPGKRVELRSDGLARFGPSQRGEAGANRLNDHGAFADRRGRSVARVGLELRRIVHTLTVRPEHRG
jgi:hypothetical protein